MQFTSREARQQFSRLLKAVEQGKEVEITRGGRVVARLTRPETREAAGIRRAVARQALRDAMPPARSSSTDLIRELRDNARY